MYFSFPSSFFSWRYKVGAGISRYTTLHKHLLSWAIRCTGPLCLFLIISTKPLPLAPFAPLPSVVRERFEDIFIRGSTTWERIWLTERDCYYTRGEFKRFYLSSCPYWGSLPCILSAVVHISFVIISHPALTSDHYR